MNWADGWVWVLTILLYPASAIIYSIYKCSSIRRFSEMLPRTRILRFHFISGLRYHDPIQETDQFINNEASNLNKSNGNKNISGHRNQTKPEVDIWIYISILLFSVYMLKVNRIIRSNLIDNIILYFRNVLNVKLSNPQDEQACDIYNSHWSNKNSIIVPNWYSYWNILCIVFFALHYMHRISCIVVDA